MVQPPTHTYIHTQQYPEQIWSFWAEAVWKYLKIHVTCCYYNKLGLLDHLTGAIGLELLWLSWHYDFIVIGIYLCCVWIWFQISCVIYSCLWWWQSAAEAEVKQLAGGGWKRKSLSVWLTHGWPVLLPSLSQSHSETVDVRQGLSAARVPAGVWLWTSN